VREPIDEKPSHQQACDSFELTTQRFRVIL
jgi:hypothetical protein